MELLVLQQTKALSSQPAQPDFFSGILACCSCGPPPKKLTAKPSGFRQVPTCPPCLIYEAYYRRETLSGQCRQCAGALRDPSSALCFQCATKIKACYFCGTRNSLNAQEWLVTIEEIAEKELQRIAPDDSLSSDRIPEEVEKEEHYRKLLEEEWQIFVQVWRILLASNPPSEKIFQMRSEYMVAAEKLLESSVHALAFRGQAR
mmetsp:Transcript_15551/g.26747  ORF Transcript_15551/g.26747 Transcript_15551/m.26747 type:complete len:203 (+) Transcript_15551:35-643(+)|eukprot:CAMPEP_0196654102 /NCGR_PEP_ID=MMETSP1086-20130531/3779_1 /TAXON_ID=77921 /ORGANISM="Cyanoptyche  gloeocystis , Strain SAG4.97" /LENGTH=202 /DNA_ID=CAMNT_0041985663 /DNA_START=34 /DNA_END=642 /DNA_ORIENTATION=-